MSKTVKEKAKEWHCDESTVRRYCNSGIIPPAEKMGVPKAWRIPDDWPKPPTTRHGLCFLLDTIYQLNHGVDYASVKFGFKQEDVKAGYDYLISSAFMSSIDTTKLADELIDATVTPRGEALIKRENEENKSAHFKAHVTAKVNIGVVSLEGGFEVTN